jgi:hypothetical protein
MENKLILGGLVFAAAAGPLLAHEEPFGYLRGAQSEAKGEWELTQWATARVGKESGRYLGLDLATELEYGVTDRLQVAAYLLTDYHYVKDAVGSSGPFDDVNRFGLNGTSFELKYQLLDPFKDSFGLSLYFEPGYNSIERAGGARHDEFEMETKFIVQKNFLANRLVAVANYTIEPEWVRSAGTTWETNLKMEWTAGLSWKFAQHWWLGVETRLDTEFGDADLNNSNYVTFSAGPTLHYAGEKLFATLTVLPQVWGWPDQTGTGGLHLDDRERVEVRFKIGTEF